MTGAVAPSGAQTEIAYGGQRAVIVEVGGGLRSYQANGRPLLDGYDVDEMCRSGRGQVLIPWPNRLQDGRFEFERETHQAPLNEVETGNAIHGLVRWHAWRLREQEAARVVIGYVLHPQPGYPFALDVSIEYALSEDGLTVTTVATNVGADRCPFGAGAHPYLTLGTGSVDPLTLTVPARTVLSKDDRGVPTGRFAVDGTDYDYRQPRPIGQSKLDDCFTDLEYDADRRARVALQRTDDGAELSLWVDETYPYLMLFTGDPLPDVNRRALAVEPMTCPPNAFRSGEALVTLEPGASHRGAWGLGLR